MASDALLTDLYELTMVASYVRHGMHAPATFDLFVRSLPEQRRFLISCGLEEALFYLERLRFDDEDIDAVRQLGRFDESFCDWLRTFRFEGEVWAIPEGEAVFGNEPLLRVTAPLPQAQFVESYLLNCLSFQTMIASKAARIWLACGERRTFVDFSLRRDHGPSAATFGARAAFVGGASGTSNVQAAARYGIPASGTMAHSYLMALEDEHEAFLRFARQYGRFTILLIDTWDTLQGAAHAAKVAKTLVAEGVRISGVRIDSGDLAGDARRVRALFDAEGLPWLRIFLSGDLDEHRIAKMVAEGVPVDAFGVGTQLGTSADAPSLGAVYKLAEVDGSPRMKLSHDKVTLPGRKQVFREERDGVLVRDVLGLEHEHPPGTRPLLQCVMRGGQRTEAGTAVKLEVLQARTRRTLRTLPEPLRRLDGQGALEVSLSPGLAALLEQTRRGLEAKANPPGN